MTGAIRVVLVDDQALFRAGIAMVLGGDLGSALLIQVLSLRHDWLSPLLLVIGGHKRGSSVKLLEVFDVTYFGTMAIIALFAVAIFSVGLAVGRTRARSSL